MTRLAQLIATEEGFFKTGTVPSTHNNPGDLRHSPHSVHLANAPNGIGIIDSDIDGWYDLDRQLKIYSDRGLNLRQMICGDPAIGFGGYAPSSDGNDSERYLKFVCTGLGFLPNSQGIWGDELVSNALTIMV